MSLFLEIAKFPVDDPVTFTFFAGYMAMFAASVFFFMERSRVSDEWKTSLLVSGLITGIAAVHYYYMRNYYPVHGSPVVLRYVDWTLTVPLMCVEFYLITKKAGGTTAILWKLILASVAMLVLGYIGEAFYADQSQSWVWGALSGAAYFYIVWLVMAGDVAKLANAAGGKVAKANSMLAKFVVIGWAIYPIGYILGTEGGLFGMSIGSADDGLLNLCYNIADAVNKIGFGLVVYSLAISKDEAAA
ncbi:MAG: bacteriorhodopsin [Schleiferiaceae bacterium]|jgi:sensory rhodopsin|nr:rhodopsin [Flavobacteriia bacterium]